MSVFARRGFKAHKQEEERREKEKKQRQGKLWRFFLADGEEDIPLRFLTEEPILFYEHSLKVGKNYTNETCKGEGCEHCESGDRPSYKGAWLVTDGREREVKERKNGKETGKTITISDQVKLYVRGSKDIAKLDRLSRKFGLTSRPWFATKTGTDTSTSYELDRGEEDELTEKQIKNLLAKLPEELRNHYDGSDDSLMDIVESQVIDDFELNPSEDTGRDEDEEDEDDEDLDDDVESVEDDEEEEEKPKKKLGSKKAGAKKSLASKKSTGIKKPVAKKSKSVFKRK